MTLLDRGRRVIKGALEDNITGEAAKAAFYFFLSLFPMIMAGFALTGFIGGSAAFDVIMGWLQRGLPEEATAFLAEFVREITDERRPEALSLGVLLAIWSGSNFFAALGDGLDSMFDVRGRARGWKRRLKAVMLLFVGGALLLASAIALIAGPGIGAALGLQSYWQWLAWPVVFMLLVFLLFVTYRVMPAHSQAPHSRALIIGAVAGTALWLIATLVFRIYVTNVANFGRTYGFIGGIIVLLLWLYLTALAVLLGGEVADALDEAAPVRAT
jgi:membrane protein